MKLENVDIKEEVNSDDINIRDDINIQDRFCMLCSASDMSLSDLKDHLAAHLSDDPLVISIDSTEDNIYPKFSTFKHITYRPKTIGSSAKVYSCSLCGLFTIYLSDVARHINKECTLLSNSINLLAKQAVDYIKCDYCNRKYSHHGEYVRHLRIHASKSKNAPTLVCAQFHGSEQVNNNEQISEYKFICVTCGKTYLMLSSLETHMVCHAVEPAKCNTCGKVFKNNVMLKTHMMLHTKEHPFPCHVCGNRFVLQTSLAEHVKQAHKVKNNNFPCKYCNRIFTSKLRQRIHHDGHVKNASQKLASHLCSICGKCFSWKSNLTSHEKQVHRKDSRVHMCSVCGNTLKTAISLRYHMANHEGIQKFICDVCGLGFYTPRNLRIHMFCHSDLRPFACKLCSSTFKHVRNLQHHRKTVHSIVPREEKSRTMYPCTVCKKKFASLEFQMDHMRIHNNEQPFQCKVCEKKFTHYQGLFQHLRTGHTLVPTDEEKLLKDEKRLKCSLCNQRFETRITLRDHSIEKHGRIPVVASFQSKQMREPIECKHCGQHFVNSQSFINHTKSKHGMIGDYLFACKYLECNKCYKNLIGLRQHEKKHHKGITGKMYQCHICEKMFTSKSGRDFHIDIHTGRKAFTCEVCGKSFRLKGSLMGHALTHTNLKPVTCAVCNKNFRQRSHLITHMRTHTGERPYACNICGRAFAQSGDRNKHRINMHKNVPPGNGWVAA